MRRLLLLLVILIAPLAGVAAPAGTALDPGVSDFFTQPCGDGGGRTNQDRRAPIREASAKPAPAPR